VEGAGGLLSGVLSGMGQREPKCPPPPDCWRIIAWSAALSMAASRRPVPGLALTEWLISKLPGCRSRQQGVAGHAP
jgi:hypothetical protein